MPLDITLDNEYLGVFQGHTWARMGILAGQHLLKITFAGKAQDAREEIIKVVEVTHNTLTRVEIQIPSK